MIRGSLAGVSRWLLRSVPRAVGRGPRRPVAGSVRHEEEVRAAWELRGEGESDARYSCGTGVDAYRHLSARRWGVASADVRVRLRRGRAGLVAVSGRPARRAPSRRPGAPAGPTLGWGRALVRARRRRGVGAGRPVEPAARPAPGGQRRRPQPHPPGPPGVSGAARGPDGSC